ncbi:hypothetical protein [Stenotrophomonas bentonitica]|uniref:hypothetical protein n=1 Tax=Stenotrophomonas bentonitica TaxID=1450134 RepID=UPI0031BBBE57
MDVRLYPCHAKSTRRAGLARAALFAHVIDGKSYTTRQVATQLGLSLHGAARRIKRGPYPLTWSTLQQSRLVKS